VLLAIGAAPCAPAEAEDGSGQAGANSPTLAPPAQTTNVPSGAFDTLKEINRKLKQIIDQNLSGDDLSRAVNRIGELKKELVKQDFATQTVFGVPFTRVFLDLDGMDVLLETARIDDANGHKNAKLIRVKGAKQLKDALEKLLMGATTTPPQQAFAPNKVFDGCIAINPQGNTTILGVTFTVSNPESGNYSASFTQSPSGPLFGTGTASNGTNPIVIPITATAFGTYGQLSVTAPDGKPVQPGPLTQQVPLTLNASTDKPNRCNPAALKTPLPGPTARSSDVKAVTRFLDVLANDIATGNVGHELATLNPAVIQRYGADQCRSLFAASTDPTAAFKIKEVTGPIQYDYTSDGLTTTVPNTFFVDATRTVQGQPQDQTLHVAKDNNGSLSWFTACGTPLTTAK